MPVGERVRFSDDGLLNLEDVVVYWVSHTFCPEIGMVAVESPYQLRVDALKNRIAPDFVLPAFQKLMRLCLTGQEKEASCRVFQVGEARI